MSEALELLLGKICVEKGLLTQQQLRECLEAADAPLSEFLVRQGRVPGERMEALRRDASRLFGRNEYHLVRKDDELLGQILVRRGHVTAEQLRKALDAQKNESRPGGRVTRIGEFLIRDGAVRYSAIEEALREQGRLIWRDCSVCGMSYGIPRFDPTKIYLCRKCGGTVSAPAEVSDGPEEVRSALKNPKQRLGKYVLVQEAGRGGMGVVYKAWDSALRRWVAIKLLTSPGDSDDLTRFQREAQTAAALKHPNIVAIHEVGHLDGRYFIAMEYVDGPTLARRRLPVRRAAEAMLDVARALEYAHSKGIVHRDLKPQNVMLDGEGTPHVMDFGLAKNVRAESQLTVSGTIVGTPSYMAPEQALGKIHIIDRRTDVYGLGAVLYEVLTGRAPFQGGSPLETLGQVVDAEVRPPSSINRAVPEEVDTIVLRCLEKEKARRYPSARLLAEDLDRWLKGEPIAARRSSIVQRLGRQAARNKPLLAAAAAIAAALAVVLLGVAQSGRTREAERAQGLREAESAFERREWERAETLYQKAGAWKEAERCRKKIDEAEAAAKIAKERDEREVRERKRKEEEKKEKEAEVKKAREEAQKECSAGRRKLEEAKLDLYREGADLARLEAAWVEAVATFARAIRLFPEYPEAHYLRGLAYFALQDHDAAEADFTKAIDLQKSFGDAYYERGRLRIERVTFLRGLIRRAPSTQGTDAAREKARADIAEFRRLGGAASEHAAYADALLAFSERRDREALEMCDRLIVAQTARELVYKLKGDLLSRRVAQDPARTADAIRAYDEAIRLRVNYFEAYLQRGNMRYCAKDVDGAIQDYDKALAINRRFPDAYINRGVMLTTLGRRTEARKDFLEAIRLSPRESFALDALGVLSGYDQDYPRAVEWHTQAIEADPRNATALVNRGAALRWMNKFDAALEDYEAALRIDPDYASAYFNRAIIFALRDDWDTASKEYGEFIRRHRERDASLESGYFSRAQAYYRLEKYAEAIADWEECLKLPTQRRADIEKRIEEAKRKLNP